MKKSCISIFWRPLFSVRLSTPAAPTASLREVATSSRSAVVTIAHAGLCRAGERIPEKSRLTGMAVGYSGPWGQLSRQPAAGRGRNDERAWLARARRGGLPPMPWSALQAMSEKDLRAVYRYLRHLGRSGEAAPARAAAGRAHPDHAFRLRPTAADDRGSSVRQPIDSPHPSAFQEATEMSFLRSASPPSGRRATTFTWAFTGASAPSCARRCAVSAAWTRRRCRTGRNARRSEPAARLLSRSSRA